MKRYLVAFILLIFTLPIFAKNTILVLGDSLSSGYGIALEKSWVKLLENRLDDEGYEYTIVNASIAGDTTSNGLARLPKLIEQHTPNITIVELGGNDGLRGIQLVSIKNNLQQIISQLKEAGSAVLLVGIRLPPNLGPDYTQQFFEMYATLATENNISLVPIFLKGVDENNQLMQDDRIHPTVEAQPIILENVWPVLQKMLH